MLKLPTRAEDYAAVDSVSKVDPSNALQLDRLHAAFSHNTAVVNFWLGQCVFNRETKQHSQKLTGSAWDVAESPHVIGFSGTNDNQGLLPLQVAQAEAGDQALKATNGKMLDLLLRPAACHTLAGGEVRV